MTLSLRQAQKMAFGYRIAPSARNPSNIVGILLCTMFGPFLLNSPCATVPVCYSKLERVILVAMFVEATFVHHW